MKYDIFFSICQTDVDGYLPSEAVMWRNFFSQVERADELGFGTGWVAETHLSCQVQKRNPGAVIPHFSGEIGLNTDILQLAHVIFSRTKRLHVGSAIRNILCNGGPIAHAEAIRTFLSLHALSAAGTAGRILDIGFAAGRFPFSNVQYGIRPRNQTELAAWPVLRGLIFQEAVEIFLRFLRGDIFSSQDVRRKRLSREQFRAPTEWDNVVAAYRQDLINDWPREITQIQARKPQVLPNEVNAIEIPAWWVFDQVGVIPFEAPLDNLRLTIGAHDAASQNLANEFMPVGVFNLSITPTPVIEETHKRMTERFHKKGGAWTRQHMPRTVLVFIDENGGSLETRRRRAQETAEKALSNYWRAIEGTLDPEKVRNAVGNALVGSADDIRAQLAERFHPEDRLMLWFDFNNHDTGAVEKSMRDFMQKVVQ